MAVRGNDACPALPALFGMTNLAELFCCCKNERSLEAFGRAHDHADYLIQRVDFEPSGWIPGSVAARLSPIPSASIPASHAAHQQYNIRHGPAHRPFEPTFRFIMCSRPRLDRRFHSRPTPFVPMGNRHGGSMTSRRCASMLGSWPAVLCAA